VVFIFTTSKLDFSDQWQVIPYEENHICLFG
jgi:hypothetical protein